ncbi:MAG: RNA methyltransferase [Fusobacteriaceae bacterium]|jgi:hypothetical protein|nr:RNA methyltransferase [Fusobacteriaceae bacterium]
MRNNLYVALVHYPVYNRKHEEVCTSVTNFDIHDISRTCRTYGVREYHLIIPADAQKVLTERIISYWREGAGGNYNKNRGEAFGITRVTGSIEKLIHRITTENGAAPVIVTTSARTFTGSTSYEALAKAIRNDERPYLILFGTGWGLTDAVMDMADVILEPIRGKSEYNHLSVRAAAAIILDRLLGEA